MAKWQLNSATGYALAREDTYCLAAIERTPNGWQCDAIAGRELLTEKFANLANARVWCEQKGAMTAILAEKAWTGLRVLRATRDILSQTAPDGRPSNELAAVFQAIDKLDDALKSLALKEEQRAAREAP